MRVVMGIGCWKVLATWYGKERVVFTGSIWECIRFVKDNS